MYTLYTKNNCPQCMMTKHHLDKLNVTYQIVNVDDDLQAKDWLLSQNITTVPVFTDGQVLIKGFDIQAFNDLS